MPLPETDHHPAATRADRELAAHLDNTPLIVLELDRDFRIVRWTGQAENVFGWSAAEAVGRTGAELRLVHPDDAATVDRLLREMIDRRNPRNVHVNRNLTRGGAVVWCQWHNSAQLDGDGRVISVLSLGLDVTERRAADEALVRSEARLRTFLSSARMLGWEWDLAGNCGYPSADFAGFFGLPPAGDYTTPAGASRAIHPADLPGVAAAWRHAVGTGADLRCEFRGSAPDGDGRDRWFSVRGQILRDPAGAPDRVFAVTTDVTAQKRAEQEREALDRQLLDAQKWESLGVLAGGVAHDFNNILTVVLGSATLARRTVAAESQAAEYLDQIEQASQRAAGLCRQMLAYAGRGPAPTGRADLNQLIRESEPLLSVSSPRRAVVRLELAADLPPLRADAAQVRQVLISLAMNAGEAVPDGGEVVIRTAVVSVADGASAAAYRLAPEPGVYAMLEVTDNGPGIPPETVGRMFDPFFTTKFPGRGLGLAAVLGIVKSHRGAIRVDTAPGRGTTVRVLWRPDGPVKAAAVPIATPPPRPAAALPLPPAVEAAPGSKGLALVVDDEVFIREVAASTLEEMGYTPILAGDGPAGVELFRRNRDAVRVAVIDLLMPGLSGNEVLAAIRALNPDLPAVIVSGHTDRRTPPPLGRTVLLHKPFRPEDLSAVVQRLVAQS